VRNKGQDLQSSRWIVQVYEERSVTRRDFSTPSEASEWAARLAREANIRAGSDFHDLCVSDIFDRYGREESPKRVAHQKQLTRFRYFKTQMDVKTGKQRYPLVGRPLRDLTRFDFVAFRDQHQQEVSSGTFLQDWSLIHRAVKLAVNEWGWLHRDPMQGIALPHAPIHRHRRISEDEIKTITERLLQLDFGGRDLTVPTKAALVFHLAIETALRRSEIFSLRREDALLDRGYLRVSGIEPSARKSAAAVRNVPLTSYARELLSFALKQNWHEEFLFGVQGGQIDKLFQLAVKSSGIKDLHFHDTRHEAISRLASYYRAIDLATIVGHKNIQELMTYYRPEISQLVEIMQRREKTHEIETQN